MKQLIADLRERPKEDRAAFAGLISGLVVVLLFVVWATFFIRGIQEDARVRAARSAAFADAPSNPALLLQDATAELADRYDEAAKEYAALNAQVAAVGQLSPPSGNVTIGPITVLATSTPTPPSDIPPQGSVDERAF